jgi:hypothetical protein
MLKVLIKLADRLDKMEKYNNANTIDHIIQKLAINFVDRTDTHRENQRAFQDAIATRAKLTKKHENFIDETEFLQRLYDRMVVGDVENAEHNKSKIDEQMELIKLRMLINAKELAELEHVIIPALIKKIEERRYSIASKKD